MLDLIIFAAQNFSLPLFIGMAGLFFLWKKVWPLIADELHRSHKRSLEMEEQVASLQKAIRISLTDLVRAPTDGHGNVALATARADVDALAEVVKTDGAPPRVTVQDVFDYHAQLDATRALPRRERDG
jgi:hypothetical protein